MKTSTVLSRSLLLMAMLAVSWAVAVPLQDIQLLQDIRSEEQLQEFLENNPSVALQLFPDLLSEASQVLVVIDPDVVVEMLRRKSQEVAAMQEEEDQEEQEEPQEETEENEHDRKKRQATLGFGMSRGPYGRDYHASAGYDHRFNNGMSSIGVNAHRNWGSSGNSHGLGVIFKHRFRR